MHQSLQASPFGFLTVKPSFAVSCSSNSGVARFRDVTTECVAIFNILGSSAQVSGAAWGARAPALGAESLARRPRLRRSTRPPLPKGLEKCLDGMVYRNSSC
ncbi:hypothetical protein EVAR_42632_1 [Eumeta japonica]|uniref:Uncharacterized protein n=1 Tax=Eumeta variegata TaxID=151549 RepID=A0A4C1WVA5_EUMVA|nr:hypothetical protein EVAR_42632_1 [Eumeta japonica]